MKAVQIPSPGSDFAVIERPVPDPGTGTVRVKVAACGVCHSDSFVKEGHWPGLAYPRVLGHEVAGVIDAVGPDVIGWAPGDRVGIGWHRSHCGFCDPCRSGDFIACSKLTITGFHFDGGL
jgi:propanol-preferring alcohol dehydrogenase